MHHRPPVGKDFLPPPAIRHRPPPRHSTPGETLLAKCLLSTSSWLHCIRRSHPSREHHDAGGGCSPLMAVVRLQFLPATLKSGRAGGNPSRHTIAVAPPWRTMTRHSYLLWRLPKPSAWCPDQCLRRMSRCQTRVAGLRLKAFQPSGDAGKVQRACERFGAHRRGTKNSRRNWLLASWPTAPLSSSSPLSESAPRPKQRATTGLALCRGLPRCLNVSLNTVCVVDASG
ncbi:uncharacterized protein LY79DRAFT_532499 [Colletotrichum navitas]|uniref:Uncharacterized protein n=1 Tax=Colletotrichum navitas TaxID=681940 RepID=A0AAD8QCJ3_9PEZI|nr:uncharacterized protein LY79DRAFT_532499 [Colletotrichum navitas]KAK1600082.1 hypothetical protein LY79DRAFT_532499 [Colletotrichum navitas]